MKEMKLMITKAPESFIKIIDNWRGEITRKNNIPISRPMAFKLLEPTIRNTKVSIKSKPRSNDKIFSILFDPNLRRKR